MKIKIIDLKEKVFVLTGSLDKYSRRGIRNNRKNLVGKTSSSVSKKQVIY